MWWLGSLMANEVSNVLRRRVAERAFRVCEYFLVHEDDLYRGCEVNHILSLKHGGPPTEDNLALIRRQGDPKRVVGRSGNPASTIPSDRVSKACFRSSPNSRRSASPAKQSPTVSWWGLKGTTKSVHVLKRAPIIGLMGYLDMANS